MLRLACGLNDVAGVCAGQGDGKCRTLTQMRLELDLMAEFGGEAADDRKAEPETGLLAVVDLAALEFKEDRLSLRFGDARAGVVHLDRQLIAPQPAPHQHAACLRIA